MAIQITKEQFEKKFGHPPALETTKPAKKSSGVLGSISDAFKSGVNKTVSGYKESSQGFNSGNFLKGAEGSLKMTAGALSVPFSPLAPLGKPLEAGMNKSIDEISNYPAVQKFATSKAGEVTQRAAEDIGNLADIFGVVAGGGEAPAVKQAVSSGVKTAAKSVKPAINATGRVLKSAGESAYGITVTPEEATSQALRKYNAKQPTLAARIKNVVAGTQPEGKPITEANTAARLGMVGTEKELGVQATRHSGKLWKEVIEPKLDAVKGAVNMKTFLGDIEKEIKSGKAGVRKGQLLDALETVKDSFKNVNSKVNLKTLQNYKEEWAKFIPDSAYKGKPIGAAIKEIQDMMAGKARGVIYKHIGEDGKQAYIDYGNLKSIEKAADKSTKDLAKQSLTKDVWQMIMDKAITPVATSAGKVLYKTGDGLEFVGQKGAKTVKDVVGD